MKKQHLIAAITLVGAALIASAQAAPITYTTGDIILGFEITGGNNSGGTQNLLIDIGQYSNLGSFTSIDISGDLNTTFGTNLWQSGQISYGALGVSISGAHWGNVYESAGAGNTLAALNGGNTSVKTDYQVLTGISGNGYQNLVGNITSSWTGYGVQVGSHSTGAWGTYNPSAAAFGVTGNNTEATIGTPVSLYLAVYHANVPNAFTNTGYSITVNTSGNLSVSAVPEPSTYALLGLASLLFVIGYRRRTKYLTSSINK